MQADILALVAASAGIACIHTATGPDHYLPFIALAKTRGWSFTRTLGWTILCGCAHVGSSVLLGLGGAALGWSLSKIAWLENVRGGVAGWVLLIFGVVYGLWGWIRLYRNTPHKHFDRYEDGSIYVYEHKHGKTVAPEERYKVTPWVMFIIFLLGPCEPMIPLMYFPAAKNSWQGMLILIAIYTSVTLVTMAVIVMLGYSGVSCLQSEKSARYTHVLGGLTLFICGAGMVFMGW